MARKKTIKDVEAEEKVKKDEITETEEELDEKEVEEVEEEIVEAEDDEEVDKKKTKKNKKDTSLDDDDDDDEEKKKTKKDGYIKQVNRELKKVVWPKGSEIVKYSVAVLVFCAILCLFFVGISLLFSKIVEVFF